MESENENQSLLSPSPSNVAEEPAPHELVDVPVDLNTQTGLKSPPAKRVKISGSPQTFEISGPLNETDDYESNDGSSSSDADSPESFILDLFHAEGAGEYGGGMCLFREI